MEEAIGHHVEADRIALNRGVLLGMRNLRIKQHLSQEQLAKLSNITQAAISELETYKRTPTIRTLIKIATVLNIDPSALFQPSNKRTLGRHAVDRIAQAVLSGNRNLSREEQRLAEAVGSQVIQKLRAHRVSGRTRYSKSRWLVAQRNVWIKRTYGQIIPRQILHRIDRLLAMSSSNEAI